MMKFFRRHTKHLLAVFMALLLVVWLLEGTLNKAGGGGGGLADIAWGEAYGQKVSSTTPSAVLAKRDTEILERLSFPWNAFWVELLGQMASQVRGKPLSFQEWYMLDADARRRGVYVPQDEINKLRDRLPADRVQIVRTSLKASLDDIDHALQSYLRVQHVFANDVGAVGESEADIQEFIRRTSEKARVKLALLEQSQFVDNTYQPTEQELKAQFEKYKDKDKSFGTDGYGYRLPEEVQIEYIAVHEDALAKKQQITDEDAYNFWKAHEKEFLKPATQPESQPATAPASREAPKPYKTYDEARQAVRTRLQNDRARKEALRIATEVAKTLNSPWANQPATQPGGFKEVPAVAIDPQLYSRTVDEFRKRYGDVLTYERTQYHSAADFSGLGPIARARALGGTRDVIGVPQATFLVQGLEAQRKDHPQQVRFFHNLYETLPEPFVDNDGNAYVVRTIAARPKRSPASWELVKEDLAKDIRLMRATEAAKAEANRLTEQAKKTGLEEAVNQDPAVKQRLGEKPVQTPEPFARVQAYGQRMMPSMVPHVGMDEKFIEAVFSMTAATTTQPSRVALYTPAGDQRWIIVQLLEILPVTQAEYQQQRDTVAGMTLMGRRMRVMSDWLSAAQIRERVSWKSAQPEHEEKQGEEPQDMDFDFGA